MIILHPDVGNRYGNLTAYMLRNSQQYEEFVRLQCVLNAGEAVEIRLAKFDVTYQLVYESLKCVCS